MSSTVLSHCSKGCLLFLKLNSSLFKGPFFLFSLVFQLDGGEKRLKVLIKIFFGDPQVPVKKVQELFFHEVDLG